MSDDPFEVTPWKHNDRASWERREANRLTPRVEPLNRLVEVLRHESNEHIPWIDPFCGGIEARILLVLERPGRLGAIETDFLSLANVDDTARNTIAVMRAAGISYCDVTFWNAIPWSGDQKRVTASMRPEGSVMFGRLLPRLPRLRTIILMGNEAQRIGPLIQWPKSIDALKCAHPGPFVWNQLRYTSQKEGIFAAFRKAVAGKP